VSCRGDEASCTGRDLVRTRVALLIWCLPAALVVLGIFWPQAREALWIPSFAVMGSACLLNARRCGRLHCHLTGPLFLLAALATLLDSLAIVRVPWPWIVFTSIAGTAIGYGLEHIRGEYVSK